MARVVDIQSWVDMAPSWLARLVIWTADGTAETKCVTRIAARVTYIVRIENALLTLGTEIIP